MLSVSSRVGALGKILRENPEFRAATLPAVRSSLVGNLERRSTAGHTDL
jgi:hypothetical protein